MSTGKNWKAAALIAGFGLAFLFTGCGGGDSGSNTVAPGALETRSYDFSPNTGGQTAVSFTSPTAYTFQHEDGTVEQGTYQALRDGNLWSVTLSSTTGGQQIYNMTFNTGSSGNFVLKRDSEADRFGPFTVRSSTIATDDGSTTTATTTSTTDGSGTPSTSYNGFAPTAIDGRVMFGTRTFTSTGPNGQTHTYTFGNGTFHDSDAPEESDGTFVYNAGNSTATMQLNYTRPSTFAGDSQQWTMTFTAKDKGTFQSTYTRGDGTAITINGNFEFQPIP
jgi:hypothetical protein